VSASLALLPWLSAPLAQGLASRAHALLLHGPGAVGQFELGLALASGWLCEAGAGTPHPCGHCPSCRLMAAQMHPDFHLLLPEASRVALGWGTTEEVADGDSGARSSKPKAKPSKEIRVEAVRAAIDWGQKTTSRGRAKVILIHPAQAMNAIAANALLKTLEEPAGRLRLVLTAHDPEALLPTLRSRCQRLYIGLPPEAQAIDWLAGQGLARPDVLLAASGGQVLEAMAMANDGIDSDAWERLPAAVRRGLAAPLADWPLVRLIDALQKLCHDLMCLRAGAAPRFFSSAVLTPLLPPNSTQGSAWAALGQWAQELTLAARHDEHPWHAGLRNEALVGQGARLWQTPRSLRSAGNDPLDTLGAR
jgi:DNA polymerase-3 subunit delta'